MKLTKRTVEAIEPSAKDVLAWDSGVVGFGVRVKPSGVRTYVLKFRNASGRQRWMKLGRHGALTVDQARKMAQQRLAEVAQGRDPASEKAEARKAPTVSELCDRFLVEHVKPKTKPATATEYESLVKTRIKPKLGNLKAAAVTRANVMKLHGSMSKTPRRANLALSVLSKMFNLAELWGIRPEGSNPCGKIQRYPEVQRERFLSEHELGRLGEAMAEAERTASEQPTVLAAIKLLALTGCRRGEILTLRWDYIDFDSGAFYLPDAKAGARMHPVGDETLDLLESLPREEGCPYVLPNPSQSDEDEEEEPQPLSKYHLRYAWARLRAKAEITDARVHDLRHTVGTVTGAIAPNSILVMQKLGHTTPIMAQRYVSRDAGPLRVLSNRVEGRIAGAMAGNEAEVISIERGRKTPKM